MSKNKVLKSVVMQWHYAEEHPKPQQKVIAIYQGKVSRRTIMAMHLPSGFRECDCEFDCNCEYDKKRDEFYYPEGWYEVVENWAAWGFIPVSNGEITHWMSLPEDPVSGE